MRYLIIVLVATLAGAAIYFLPRHTTPTHPQKTALATTDPGEATATQVPSTIPAQLKQIPLPAGFTLEQPPANSFGAWLMQLPLRKNNTLYLHNGTPKPNQRSHYAVLDVPYNGNPLQQCADAVMRLQAEYLYATKAQPAIRFLHQNNRYLECPVYCTRPQLESYLNNVFTKCGSYNLSAQLTPVADMQNIQAGDVFVKGGSPGHAMLVAAVAGNAAGEKMFLLVQGFMPAQDMHIVVNPFNEKLSPWYAASGSYIATPGWTFTPEDLKSGL